MNLSKRHQPVATRVRYGNPAMCTAIAPPERRECLPTYSEANPSLAAPTRQVLAMMTEILFEALTERSPWAVG